MVPTFRSWRMCAASVAFLACGGGGGGGGQTPTGPNPPGGSSGAAANASVSMSSGTDPYGYETNVFNPSAVTIRRNGTVTWINPTGIAHSVTFSTSGAPANIASHTSGSTVRTFPTSGTFSYVCSNHPTMTGSVTVQ